MKNLIFVILISMLFMSCGLTIKEYEKISGPGAFTVIQLNTDFMSYQTNDIERIKKLYPSALYIGKIDIFHYIVIYPSKEVENK